MQAAGGNSLACRTQTARRPTSKRSAYYKQWRSASRLQPMQLQVSRCCTAEHHAVGPTDILLLVACAIRLTTLGCCSGHASCKRSKCGMYGHVLTCVHLLLWLPNGHIPQDEPSIQGSSQQQPRLRSRPRHLATPSTGQTGMRVLALVAVLLLNMTENIAAVQCCVMTVLHLLEEPSKGEAAASKHSAHHRAAQVHRSHLRQHCGAVPSVACCKRAATHCPRRAGVAILLQGLHWLAFRPAVQLDGVVAAAHQQHV